MQRGERDDAIRARARARVYDALERLWFIIFAHSRISAIAIMLLKKKKTTIFATYMKTSYARVILHYTVRHAHPCSSFVVVFLLSFTNHPIMQLRARASAMCFPSAEINVIEDSGWFCFYVTLLSLFVIKFSLAILSTVSRDYADECASLRGASRCALIYAESFRPPIIGFVDRPWLLAEFFGWTFRSTSGLRLSCFQIETLSTFRLSLCTQVHADSFWIKICPNKFPARFCLSRDSSRVSSNNIRAKKWIRCDAIPPRRFRVAKDLSRISA